MSKPFDATLKGLLELSPGSWAELAGYPAASVEVIDADVSTFTAVSDKVLARGESEWILDINFQRGPDASVPRRTHLYSTLLEYRHELPVRSVVMLLTSKAHLSVINGVYERGFPGEAPYNTFHYRIVRVWELASERLLAGGLGTLPLTPISAVTEEQLPGIIEKMKVRLDAAGGPEAKDLWTATYVLMGLRYEREVVNRLLQGVVEMEESVTYQAIIEKGMARGKEEGRREEARRMLLLQGTKRFGPASGEVVAAIEAIDEPEKLEQLGLRVLDAAGWQDLLDLPAS